MELKIQYNIEKRDTFQWSPESDDKKLKSI